MKPLQHEFKLANPRLSIESVTLQEIDGHAEKAARFRAGADNHAYAENLLAEAIVGVNGVAVETPYGDFLDWTSKTLDAVRLFFQEINGIAEDDVADPIQAFRTSLEAPASPEGGEKPKAA